MPSQITKYLTKKFKGTWKYKDNAGCRSWKQIDGTLYVISVNVLKNYNARDYELSNGHPEHKYELHLYDTRQKQCLKVLDF